jgi:hypothetical protein
LTSEQDFIILASNTEYNIGDGIFDKMSNSEVVQIIWDTFQRDEGKYKNLHEFCGLAA